ncbi:hypothetical protein DFR67_11771 [Williamsia limnetica]|uniref:Uncharacterized protein n=1 Tax=Williamsia limnetica TaxID=882452 RepID=A0A318RDY2_WILLI|nr:hypothetical protein DFR67_11771 [Williamsia limnetica]
MPVGGGSHACPGLLALCVSVTVSGLREAAESGFRPSRRSFVRSAAALSAGALAITAVGACGSGSGVSAEQQLADRLLPQVAAAQADAVAATAAIATNPDRAAALAVVATERTEHARVLAEEITRLDTGRARVASSSAAPSSVAPAPPGLDALRAQLSASARSAGDLALELDGYVAGLLGSISAGVTTAVAVQLA